VLTITKYKNIPQVCRRDSLWVQPIDSIVRKKKEKEKVIQVGTLIEKHENIGETEPEIRQIRKLLNSIGHKKHRQLASTKVE
jgi:hypothetical protein